MEIQAGNLVVSGEKSEEAKRTERVAGGGRVHRSERTFNSFSRCVRACACVRGTAVEWVYAMGA